jgi:hypothetical protein
VGVNYDRLIFATLTQSTLTKSRADKREKLHDATGEQAGGSSSPFFDEVVFPAFTSMSLCSQNWQSSDVFSNTVGTAFGLTHVVENIEPRCDIRGGGREKPRPWGDRGLGFWSRWHLYC